MAAHVKAWLSRRWPPILSAALYLLAFPPFDVWPLALVALAPMLWYIGKSDAKEAWRTGYVFGLLVFLGQMFWLYSLAEHWTGNPGLALLPWIVSAALEGLFFGWVALLIRRCYSRHWLLLVPVAWAGVEVCRSYIPVVAFPWGLAATPLYREPLLIQSAHFGTIYLVSAWVVLVNVIVADAFNSKTRHNMGVPIAVCGALLALSGFYYLVKPPSDPFPVSIGQPGADLAFGDQKLHRAQMAKTIDRLTDAAMADGSRLLVLPEGIYEDDPYPPRTRFHIDKRLPVLFGGTRGTGPVYQTAFSFDGRWHYADKTRLVIFGEFVPGRDTFPFIAKWFDLPPGDLSASKAGVKSVDVAGTVAGPMLCFEGLFPEISYQQARNGARFIAVMCIDDWYMGTTAPEQLKAASIFRAVEVGLPLARSASMGYSLALDGHGRILGELPLKLPGALKATLDLPKESTLFPFLPAFPVAAFIFVFALPFVTKRKPSEPEEADPTAT